MSPDLQLQFADGTLQFRGSVEVPTARVNLERLDSRVSVSPDVVVLDPRQESGRSVFLVDTDVELRLGKAVKLSGFGLDGMLGGSLRIRDRPGRAAQANGSLNISGRYAAFGRNLTITRGRLGFLNAAYNNPTLDILAEAEFEDVTVGVRVRGSALAPETTLTSTPTMSSTEILSWLLFGRPLSVVSGAERQQLDASSLALSAGSNLLAQKFASRLGLDSAGISDSRVLGGSILSIGKQVSPRLFVSYGVSLIGSGQVLTLKYLLSRGLNVSLESSNVETAGSINWRKEK
jgi:translocation and assembly module TamB